MTYQDDRVRLATLRTELPSSATPVQNLTYTYDDAGNPKEITNTLPALSGQSGNRPGSSTLTLEYDGVDRLVSSMGHAQLNASKTTDYDQRFAYSASHNLTHKQRAHSVSTPSGVPAFPNATNFSSDYTYTGARPHLPTQIGSLLLTYDPSGNPLTRTQQGNNAVQTLVWDDDNRLVDFTGNGVHQHNTFDAGGNRVRRKSTQSETVFSSHYFDLENGTQGVKHVFAGPTRVASELTKFTSGENPVAPSKPGVAYFFHVDHIGSTSVLTDESGAVYQSLEYFSDGETWIDRAPSKPVNGYLFTGKPFDPDTGFYDFGQRFYDPRTSLWLGQDPAFEASAESGAPRPIALSLSAFAAHNPLRIVDRDGAENREISWEYRQANRTKKSDAAEALDSAVSSRFVGAAKVVGGGAGFLVGAGLSETPLGWGLMLLSADFAGSGASQIIHGDPQPSVMGKIHPFAQDIEEAIVGGAGLAGAFVPRSLQNSATGIRQLGSTELACVRGCGPNAPIPEITLYHGTDVASVESIVAKGLNRTAARELGGGDVFWMTHDLDTARVFAAANPGGGAPAIAATRINAQLLDRMKQANIVAIDPINQAFTVVKWDEFNSLVKFFRQE
jgi:RHS repeat-associated protein